MGMLSPGYFWVAAPLPGGRGPREQAAEVEPKRERRSAGHSAGTRNCADHQEEAWGRCVKAGRLRPPLGRPKGLLGTGSSRGARRITRLGFKHGVGAAFLRPHSAEQL